MSDKSTRKRQEGEALKQCGSYFYDFSARMESFMSGCEYEAPIAKAEERARILAMLRECTDDLSPSGDPRAWADWLEKELEGK